MSNELASALVTRAEQLFLAKDVAALQDIFDQAASASFLSNHQLSILSNYAAQIGEIERAIHFIQLAYLCDPQEARFAFDYAYILQRLARYEEAIPIYQGILASDPSHVTTCINLGVCHNALKQYPAAISNYERALQCDLDQSNLAVIYYNLANVYHDIGDNRTALPLYKQAIELAPNNAVMLNNLGICLQEQNLVTESIDVYRAAIAADPSYPHAHFGLGLSLLLSGQLLAGWQEYEWRWRLPTDEVGVREFTEPTWQGEDLHGKTIYCYAEQGLGDSIQFIRFIPGLKAKGAKTIVECQRALIELFSTMPEIDELVASGQTEVPRFDYQCSFLGLPGRFQTTEASIPNLTPYLQVLPAYEEKWRRRFDNIKKKKKVALVWAGSKVHRNDKNRSSLLAAWAPLFSFQSIQFISLQVSERADELNAFKQADNIIDLRDEISNFADTAAILAQCDLLLSVDTSVAHLAGALGLPVWMLIPFAPDWRWMLDRTDSPWYPSMRIFRQDNVNDWDNLIQRVSSALEDFVGKS